MAAPVDPYASISQQAFVSTFDELLRRPDCTGQRRNVLVTGRAAFLQSGCTAKSEAMQNLLAAYPTENIVVSTMTRFVQNRAPGPAAAAPAPAPRPALPAALPHFTPQQLEQLRSQLPPAQFNMLQQQLLQARAAAAVRPPPALPLPPGGPRPLVSPMAGRSAAPAPQAPGAAPGQARLEDDVTADQEGPADTDLLAGAGVNLAAEESELNKSRATGRTRTLKEVAGIQQEESVLDQAKLVDMMRRVALRHGLEGVDPACAQYLSLAVEAHMARLLLSMARIQAQRRDPGRQYEGAMPVPRKRRRSAPALMLPAPTDLHTDSHTPAATSQEPPVADDSTDAAAAAPGPLSPQTHLTFRRRRPLLVPSERQTQEARFVSLVRRLDAATTLSAPAESSSNKAPSRGSAAGAGSSSSGPPHPVATLEVPDLLAALEKDSLLSKHPLLWKLHQVC